MTKFDLNRVRSSKNRALPTEILRSLNAAEYSAVRDRITDQILRRSDSAASARHARNVLRALEIRRTGGVRTRVPLTATQILARKKDSQVLSALFPERDSEWVAFAKRRVGVPIDIEQFSFLDNPDETMQALIRIAQTEAQYRDVELNFRFPMCRDIGPFIVLGLLARDMSPCVVGGIMQPRVKKVLGAVGVSDLIGMDLQNLPRGSGVWPFKLRAKPHGKPDAVSAAYSAQAKEKVADDFVATVNGWLRASSERSHTRTSLSLHGRGTLKRLINEILDNAERHAAPNAQGTGIWHIAGFMSRHALADQDEPYFLCHLSMVNTGLSIGETILTCEDQGVQQLLEDYCKAHCSNPTDTETYDRLRTVAALQPGISRLTGDPEAVHGMGFLRMTEFAHALGSKADPAFAPRITVISGTTCVRLWDNFANYADNDGSGPFLWFNEANKFDIPPLDTHVSSLPVRFPGTIVSLRFRIEAPAPQP